MATTSLQPSSPGVMKSLAKEEKRWDNQVAPPCPDFKHKVTKESSWIDVCHSPPRATVELRGVRVVSTQGQDVAPYEMHDKVFPSNHEVSALVALLKACARTKDLCRGTRLHDDILKKGLLEKCSDALVIMYAKCGALAKAKELLGLHKSRNVISWTALISGYVRHGQSQDAMNCFEQMQIEGLSPDAVTYACILKACGTIKDLQMGERIHDDIDRQGLLRGNILLGNALLDMYVKCGALSKAQQVLEELRCRNVISWNVLITGYAQHGQGDRALYCFERMQHEGLSPDAVTFTCILKALGSIKAADKGEKIHDEIARQGLLESNIVLGTALVNMYAKCGTLVKAQEVLEELPSRTVVSWNALIAGYTQQGQGEQALNCFERMQREGLSPDAVTFACILKACWIIGAVDKGKKIHDEIVRQGLIANNIVLGNALLDMYAKCGALAKAKQVLEDLPSRNVYSWNVLVVGYSQQGQAMQALNCFKQMQGEGISPNAVTFACILKACGTIGALDEGEQLHGEIARQGLLGADIVLGNALVDMYARCGALAKARLVLEELRFRDVVSWTALIEGYTQQGQGEEAWNCFEEMQCEGLSADGVTFACILKACGTIRAVDKGEQIHDEIARQGLLENNIMLGNALVDMYAKCGAVEKAQRVLEGLPSRDVISWNALIAGYAQQGQFEQALECFNHMKCEGFFPDTVTFACILKVCGSIKAVDKGEQIHDEIARQGLLGNNMVLGNALVGMYAKCGALAKAQHVLKVLPCRDVFSWNALIVGYAQQGQDEEVVKFFEQMQCEGVSPNAATFSYVLKACGSMKAGEMGEQIHDVIAGQGLLKNNIVLATAVVDMYAKCGAFAKARGFLEALPFQNVLTWNALIAGYAQQGQVELAIKCCESMRGEGLSPDAGTFTCILKACGTTGDAEKGEQIHEEIARQGLLGNNIVLGSALVNMYAKCGAMLKAQRVLEELSSWDVVCWNALITGYTQEAQGEQALNCFEQMQHEGISPDGVTYACIVKACGTIGAADKGEQIHGEIAKQGLLGNDIVLGNALVDMYMKCGALEEARGVLEELPSRNVSTWSALIAGYAQQGQGEQALICFERMQHEGLSPDAMTFVCILKACGTIGAIDKGEQIHDEIAKQQLLENNVALGSALVDMYAKCGAFTKAQQVFEELPSWDAFSWSALMAGYMQQGQGEQVLNCFKRMVSEGISPDAVTFTYVLNACSHLGLIEDGHMYFVDMSTKYGLKPDLEHYVCMVDLFGRAGHLDKAVRVIQEMPCSDYSAIWSTLLGACRKWKDVNVGKWAFEQALQIDKSKAAAYVLMADIYAGAGMQEDAGILNSWEQSSVV